MSSRMKKYPFLFKGIKKIYRFFRGILEAAKLSIKSLTIHKSNASQSILCCINNPSAYGGGEFQFKELALELKRNHLAHTIISVGSLTPNKKKGILSEMIDEGFIYIHLGGLSYVQDIAPGFLNFFLTLIFKRFKIPILHIFNLGCEALIPSAKAADMSIIYSELALPCNEPSWQKLKLYINQIDYVVAVSQKSLEGLRSICGYSGCARVIFPVIQQPGKAYNASPPEANKYNIIHFARMVKGKRGDILINAFKAVLNQFPYSTLTFVGNGEFRSYLHELTTELNLQTNITFIDYLEKEVLFNLVSNADVFCLPSASEGTPCSILEAMAIGLPVVATAVGGIPELVIHGKTGLLVDIDNVNSLSDTLILLAREPSLRKKMGDFAKTMYEQEYNEKSIKAQWMDVYNQFLTVR